MQQAARISDFTAFLLNGQIAAGEFAGGFMEVVAGKRMPFLLSVAKPRFCF
jgi:ABC-type phosphate transport system ATPase subunit